LDSGAGGHDGHVFEDFFINGVEAVELLDVAQVNGGFDDVIEGAAGGGQDLVDVVQRIKGFFFDGASDRLGRLRIDRSLAADIDPAIDFDCG